MNKKILFYSIIVGFLWTFFIITVLTMGFGTLVAFNNDVEYYFKLAHPAAFTIVFNLIFWGLWILFAKDIYKKKLAKK